MTIVFDIVDPVELTEFVRTLDPSQYGFTLDAYLPNQTHEDVEYAFNKVTKARVEVAPYRGWDVESPIVGRRGFDRVKGQIPPLSLKAVVGEEEAIRLRQLQGQNSTLAREVFDDAAMLTEALQARIELARGQALTTGEVDFSSDLGFSSDAKIDFGAITTLTAVGTVWSNPAATPIANMIKWVQDYKAANNGLSPAFALTSTKVVNNALLTTEVKSALYPVAGQGVQFPSVNDLNAFFASRGLPPLVPYDTQVNVGGSVQSIVNDELVTLLPPPSVANFGETAFGVTAESLELVSAGYLTVPTAPGLTGVNMKTFDPVHTWTKVAGVVVPVIKDTTKIAAIDVL